MINNFKEEDILNTQSFEERELVQNLSHSKLSLYDSEMKDFFSLIQNRDLTCKEVVEDMMDSVEDIPLPYLTCHGILEDFFEFVDDININLPGVPSLNIIGEDLVGDATESFNSMKNNIPSIQIPSLRGIGEDIAEDISDSKIYIYNDTSHLKDLAGIIKTDTIPVLQGLGIGNKYEEKYSKR